jgi:fatty-acyl-CoA synthase
VRGPSVTRGYYGDVLSSEETFGGGWLRTGDLGYVAEGDVFICGRAKDLIILNGRNYYPQDIEAVVSRAPGVRDGQCVAFSELDESGAERCVIVAEAKIGPRAGSVVDIAAQIMQLVRTEIGIVVGDVQLIRRGTLPKTSSGKVRRREAKKRLELGELELLTDADSKVDSIPPSALVAWNDVVPAPGVAPPPKMERTPAAAEVNVGGE